MVNSERIYIKLYSWSIKYKPVRYMIFENMSKRSKLEISYEILKIIMRGEDKPTKIMYKANISWNALKDILQLLTEKAFIYEKTVKNSTRYEIAEKGIQSLSYYQKAVKEIELLI